MEYRAEPAGLVVPLDAVLAYLPGTAEGSIEFDFAVAEGGRYRLDAPCVESFFGGIYQADLDGVKIGGPRNFATRAKYDPVWVNLDIHDLEPGKHTLRFEGTAQDAPELRTVGPRLYSFALGALTLLRLDDMAGYHAVLNEALKEKPQAGR